MGITRNNDNRLVYDKRMGLTMIEKLDIKNGGVEDLLNCIKKINEVIDVVNQLVLCEQTKTCYELIHKNETPDDTYTEQRKWEGKLCWFWDADPEDKIVDVLSCIDISDKYPYVMCDRQVHYKHCEPVKPDDDIIYKGE